MISTPVNLFHEPTGRYSQVELAQVSYWVEDGWTLLPAEQGGVDDLDAALAERAAQAATDPNAVEALIVEFVEEPNLAEQAAQAAADAAAAQAVLDEAQAKADAALAAADEAQAAVEAAVATEQADAAAGLASVTEGGPTDTTPADPAPAVKEPPADPALDAQAPTASAQPEVAPEPVVTEAPTEIPVVEAPVLVVAAEPTPIADAVPAPDAPADPAPTAEVTP